MKNNFLLLYYEHFVIPKNCFDLYHAAILGAIPGNFSRKIHGKHYMGNPKISTSVQRPASTMGYLVRLSAAKKLREIAHTERRSIFIDRVTGSADLFGMSLKLITPPCIKPNYIYTHYSNIRWFKSNMNHTNTLRKIPPLSDQELLHRFMINKWSTLVILIIRALFNKYRKRFVLRLLRSLIALELRNGINYFRPRIKNYPEILSAKQRYMEHKQSKR